ncbi:MAG TPA: septum formation family protein, partial [Mycobacterium sp.]|nr:septum formation family protein [Mycobacterium sp.]
MLDAPERVETTADEAEHPTRKVTWWRSLHATSTRRALLLTALGGLLIAGVLTALPRGEGPSTPGAITLGLRGAETFSKAKSGDCLNWPERNPDGAQVVDCKSEHRFEVAESVDMQTFPGSEYGPDAEPPSPSRIQQISQEQCQVAVRRYLGGRFDPNSRFTVSMMWSGDKAWRQSGERRMLCGLQLPGANNSQLAFQGKIAEVDQSKVWPAGTCLGIDPSTNQPTDIPVDCAGPHAMEVTGAVNVAEKFPARLPPEPDQDAFIKDACTRMTDAYLAPIQLRSTTLTLIYSTLSLPSWSAGSH